MCENRLRSPYVSCANNLPYVVYMDAREVSTLKIISHDSLQFLAESHSNRYLQMYDAVRPNLVLLMDYVDFFECMCF